LKSVGFSGFVKFRQKGIILDPLENRPGLKLIGEDSCQAGFPDTDGALDDNVFGVSNGTRIYTLP